MEADIQEAGQLLTNMLAPHLKAQNLQKIRWVVDYGSATTLMRILLDPDQEQPVLTLLEAGEHYAQFHFYAEQ